MPSTLDFGELTLTCRSSAGDQTWLKVQPPGLAIDVGRGSRRLAGVDRLFLTHGHLDHLLGVPYLLSIRGEGRSPRLEIFCPRPIAGDLEDLLRAAARLDDRRFAYEITAVEPGDRLEVGRDLVMEPFATDHVVPSLGYHLVRRRHRLRRDLARARPEELDRLRRAGEQIDESYEEIWLSASGDTSARVFELEPRLFSSRILVLECTFLAPGHRERARRFGHIHLEDLVALRDRFANQALVLYHLSRRHRPEELEELARRELSSAVPRVYVVT